MSDFNFILQEVLGITKRPDLLDRTVTAIKSATLSLHRTDFYYKDLAEVGLIFDTEDYFQSIDYRALFPRYRSLKYLRKFYPDNVINRQTGPFYKVKTPLETLDSYGADLQDVCYVAGSMIQIKSSTKEKYCLIGYYQSPVIATQDTYSSWIADEAPYAIIWAAAAIVQGTIKDIKGQQASAAQARLEFIIVSNSNITAEGS